MPKHSLRGVPDIILVKPPTGQFIGLEVKTKSGRLSDHQQEFSERLRDVGGRYYVVTSIDDVQALGL